MTDETGASNTVELATELTIAWLSNPNTRASADEVPSFLRTMHEAVGALAGRGESDVVAEVATSHTPAVSVRKSLASKDFIVSLVDGKPYKTLRRHLSRHGMTPEQYRERFGLKSDYPMVSESYSNARREMAKKIGLGRKPGMKRPAGAKKPGRKPAAAE
ncbi:MAG: MucR family transcriptional regulator [Pseudomonadota bacterium]